MTWIIRCQCCSFTNNTRIRTGHNESYWLKINGLFVHHNALQLGVLDQSLGDGHPVLRPVLHLPLPSLRVSLGRLVLPHTLLLPLLHFGTSTLELPHLLDVCPATTEMADPVWTTAVQLGEVTAGRKLELSVPRVVCLDLIIEQLGVLVRRT